MRQGLVALLLGLAMAVPAASQPREALIDAFSGQWFVFDAAYGANARTCAVTLGRAGSDGRLPVTVESCSDALPQFVTWDIEGGTLRLFDAAGALRAELGGTQRRITGVTLPGDRGIVVERATGDGSSEAIALAVQQHRCFFLGLTAECAPPAELAAPAFPTAEALAELTTLGNLVVRSQPRRDAPSVGTIPVNTCIRVNQCLSASDGVWCRAKFGETKVWIGKIALRQSEWPIVTWRNGCAPGGS